MPKCPCCKEEINELLAYSEVVNTFKLDGDGEPDVYGNEDIEGYTSFECPKCCERIFDNEENEAISFLKGEDELQKTMKEKLKQIKEKKNETKGKR